MQRTREQIDSEYQAKITALEKEYQSAVKQFLLERKAKRKPIDDEYWAKREVLDTALEEKLRQAGIE